MNDVDIEITTENQASGIPISGSKGSFVIVHLYPKEMNIYGDMGNVLTLKTRMEQRGYRVEVIKVETGVLDKEKLPIGDIYFMGGGQDNDMFKVFEDLVQNKKNMIEAEVKAGKVFLLICGAFQLFGKYFLDSAGRQMEGLGILNIETRAPSSLVDDRCIGNIVTELTPQLIGEMEKFGIDAQSKYLVGFENHSGQTYFVNENGIENNSILVGKVISGKGNNSVEKIEGARYKNVFGSYLHGSFLPKNPHFTDLLLVLALKGRGGFTELMKLDDEIEWQAHNSILSRFS